MARGQRICFVDGTHYRYCPSCREFDPNQTWRMLYCSQNCWDIEELWEKYFRDGLITREEAEEIAKTLDFSNIANFREQIKADFMALIGLTEKDIMPVKIKYSNDYNAKLTPREEEY